MHLRLQQSAILAASFHLWAAAPANAAVFAHYMVGTVDASTDHAERDIHQAMAAGFDGFALNVGQPGADWAQNTTAQLFAAASGTPFRLFFSLDTLQSGGDLNAFTPLVRQYTSHPNYHRAGSDDTPFLSTFRAGGSSPEQWAAWLGGGAVDNGAAHFVPNFDDAEGYYADPPAWMARWGSVLQGVFSWETAWPATQDAPANVSTASDEAVAAAAATAGKSYMVPLSPLQYKRLPSQGGLHYYRVGEVNLPERMAQVLALSPRPADAEVLTWNDAGEGHYISDNLWPEGIPQEILDYANAADWPHAGWLALVGAFNRAFREGADAGGMRPAEGRLAEGVMWYRTLLRDAPCGEDSLGKPDGWQAGLDAVNWAVVGAEGAEGWEVRVVSGGEEVWRGPVGAGLHYGSAPGMRTGEQRVELLDGSGNVVMAANGARDVQADAEGICNFNYQVAGFA